MSPEAYGTGTLTIASPRAAVIGFVQSADR